LFHFYEIKKFKDLEDNIKSKILEALFTKFDILTIAARPELSDIYKSSVDENNKPVINESDEDLLKFLDSLEPIKVQYNDNRNSKYKLPKANRKGIIIEE